MPHGLWRIFLDYLEHSGHDGVSHSKPLERPLMLARNLRYYATVSVTILAMTLALAAAGVVLLVSLVVGPRR